MPFSWVIYFFSWTIWIALTIALAYGIIRRKWDWVKRLTKYAVNSAVFLVGWSFYLELALIVRSPILITKQTSLESLRAWIWDHQFTDILISLITIVILLGINLLFYYKIESKRHKSDILVLTLSTVFILVACIWFTGEDTYSGFIQVRNRQ